jgi:hypothetical protein
MRLVLDARTAAFAALVDYAGLFPPASLSVPQAVDEYLGIRSGDHYWVAGRFLCRSSQLTELAAAATAKLRSGDAPWEIGVIFDRIPGESAAEANDFQAEMDPALSITAAEALLGEPTSRGADSLLDAMLSVAPEVVPFIEVDTASGKGPIAEQVLLIALALGTRRRVGGAKIRCGGATLELFPTPEDVAAFVFACTTQRLPFKATAGLHQPIRHFDDELGIERHGFVNILMASALAEAGEDIDTVEAVVADTNPENFSISAAFASWRDKEVPGSALRRMRQTGFVSYGSCDFDEPIKALEQREFLGGGT